MMLIYYSMLIAMLVILFFGYKQFFWYYYMTGIYIALAHLALGISLHVYGYGWQTLMIPSLWIFNAFICSKFMWKRKSAFDELFAENQ
jgi:hypothetical protein